MRRNHSGFRRLDPLSTIFVPSYIWVKKVGWEDSHPPSPGINLNTRPAFAGLIDNNQSLSRLTALQLLTILS